ncbi:MAG: hypothetical protein JWN48_5767 [Myxococcaceae bacterium]|nr:hypothetical protein [Myxococcaceae bacterium]
MSDRSDFVRSLVRGFAEGAGRRLGVPFSSLQKLIREALAQASSVSDRQIAKALTRVGGVREASAVCRDERIWIEATFDEGQTVSLSVQPLSARFAPRGAKEVVFRVEPPELAGRAEVRDLVGAIAALIAHTLWAPFFGRILNPQYDAIAERDGPEVRVDLRSVPAVRAAAQRGLTQLFDVLELSGLGVADGVLRLHIKLPTLMMP